MPSRRSVPRIRVDLPDGSPCSLSPSSTLDIKDALGQAKLLPKLLAEDFVFDNADDVLYFEDGRSQHFPSFPMGRQPPLFILDSHRARLPFPLRSDAFEMGDFCNDEGDGCPLLTAPTVPRMKRMMREQVYVQRWVDVLTPDNPPKHIPWTCEKPATKRKWVAEGSIFPVDVVKSGKSSARQRRVTQECSFVTDTDRFSALVDQAPHSRELCAPLEAPAIHASTESHTSTLHIRMKSAGDASGILRGESKPSHTSHHIVRTSQASSPSTLLPSIGTTLSTPSAPLAARRGKSLSGLKLQGCVIERLEYPDIPTAFRGSLIVCSPRFGTFPAPYFPDHDSMVLDLKSKCAALGNGVSAYIQDSPPPQPELATSLSIDEWAFTRGLATFDNSTLGPMDNQVPKEITDDMSTILPDTSSTPGFIPRHCSTPTSHSPGSCSSDPPGVPLPPRPALINPSTPPHVRGILKKAKSVRFEVTLGGSENHTSPVVSVPHASPERPSPLPVAASLARLRTPMPNTVKPTSGLTPVKEAPAKNIQKRSAPRPRPPPKRAKLNEKLDPAPLNVNNASEPSKSISETSVERPCRTAHAKESNSNTVPGARARQKGLLLTEIDVRRGIEGTTKGRLSTPLRNIFRFR